MAAIYLERSNVTAISAVPLIVNGTNMVTAQPGHPDTLQVLVTSIPGAEITTTLITIPPVVLTATGGTATVDEMYKLPDGLLPILTGSTLQVLTASGSTVTATLMPQYNGLWLHNSAGTVGAENCTMGLLTVHTAAHVEH